MQSPDAVSVQPLGAASPILACDGAKYIFMNVDMGDGGIYVRRSLGVTAEPRGGEARVRGGPGWCPKAARGLTFKKVSILKNVVSGGCYVTAEYICIEYNM